MRVHAIRLGAIAEPSRAKPVGLDFKLHITPPTPRRSAQNATGATCAWNVAFKSVYDLVVVVVAVVDGRTFAQSAQF